jgi:hypothetical protein
MKYDVIICLPDQHIPWVDWNAIKEISKVYHHYKRQKKKVCVVNLGDIIDAKAWSRYPKDTDDLSPQAEWDAVILGMEKLHKLLPEQQLILGNHDTRAVSRAFEVGLPRQLVKTLAQAFDYEGWTWHAGPKPLIIDNIVFMHGDEMTGTPGQRANRLGKSVVMGHSHKASIEYTCTFTHNVFGMQCGWVGDPDGMGARYASKHPVLCFKGYAVIENGVPRLIPLG